MNLRLALCIVYAGIIFGGSSVPGNQVPSLPVSDYLMHVFEYTVLGALLIWWRLSNTSILKGVALIQTILLGSIYGLLDEFHQYFVPGRCTDPLDWVADTIGTTIGALSVLALFFIFVRQHAPDKGQD
ncbi:MAG: teicoplanin resistance protein VanZ [Nitrospiraceae bacterium]|nr:teicoplanin resistance protein VanZ [Nitrospiraceae bacterium]